MYVTYPEDVAEALGIAAGVQSAGLAGRGGSSPLHPLILRQRQVSADPTGAKTPPFKPGAISLHMDT
ncbi:Hypothetical protein SMAX5B_015160 [Scophthalmus maximus]|uniref:Uncharacterized protein n=1 Tax=Scophthalmus maximus TaxID=52904 RepID=A0A2U9CEP4_SCOMX|nr:Hypothetical protein SMAX5B_015160 [Scophthalmus maximus]